MNSADKYLDIVRIIDLNITKEKTEMILYKGETRSSTSTKVQVKKMSVDKVHLPANVDVSNLSFATPKVLNNGGRSIPMYYNSKPLVFQVSNLTAPYGLSEIRSDNGDLKYGLSLSFANMHENSVRDVHKLMSDLDSKIMQEFYANAKTWAKKDFKSFDVIESLYNPIVKPYKDKEGNLSDKYPATFKVQIPSKGGMFDCEVYGANKQKIDDPSTIDWKGAKVSAILQCNGVWVIGNKFGCTFRVIQVKVVPRQKITGYAFIDDPEDKIVN